MTVRRIVPNIGSADPAAGCDFYTSVLGLEVAMDLGWVVTFVASGNPTAQITLLRGGGAGAPVPDVSIEVGDVDACHDRAVAHGCTVTYPVTDEPWGVRRFFVREPNGKIINVLSHRRDPRADP